MSFVSFRPLDRRVARGKPTARAAATGLLLQREETQKLRPIVVRFRRGSEGGGERGFADEKTVCDPKAAHRAANVTGRRCARENEASTESAAEGGDPKLLRNAKRWTAVNEIAAAARAPPRVFVGKLEATTPRAAAVPGRARTRKERARRKAAEHTDQNPTKIGRQAARRGGDAPAPGVVADEISASLRA